MGHGMTIGGGIVAAILISIFVATNPEAREFLFPSEIKPDVRFWESPTLSETTVAKGSATNIKVIARNYEEDPVKDVEAHLSVIEGPNWEQHLEFPPVTKLGDIDKELGITDSKYVEITVKDVSGVKPQFKLKLELFANGVTTGNTWTESITLTE